MRRIELNASGWRSKDDLWDALLAGLGAPDWHGRSLDALWDSLTEDAAYCLAAGRQINRVQPPFEIHVADVAGLPRPMQDRLVRVAKLFADAREGFALEVWFHLPRALRRRVGLS